MASVSPDYCCRLAAGPGRAYHSHWRSLKMKGADAKGGAVKRLLILLVFGIVVSAAVSAQSTVTGQELRRDWIAFQKAPIGKISEIVNLRGSSEFYRIVVQTAMDAKGLYIQVPDGVTNYQLCLVVGKYLDDNPELTDRTADELVSQVLRLTFPSPIANFWDSHFKWTITTSGNVGDYWTPKNDKGFYFVGFVSAIAEVGDGLWFSLPSRKNDALTAAVRDQVLAVVSKYLWDYLKQLNGKRPDTPPATLVIRALQQAFPKSGG